jgi:hypothetical protein
MKRWLIIILLAGASLFLYLLYFNSNTELHTIEAELNSTQEQLDSVKTGLATTEGELDATKTELQSTVVALDSTKIKLQAMEEDWQSAETELAATLDRLSTAQAELDDRETELSELQINYEGLMTGHGYTIKDPSYSDMLRFLEDDDTDKAEYIEDKYECIEFTTDLCNRAEEKGIRCAYVSVRFPDGRGHAIVAFNTIDKGLIYIEPQYDDLVNIVIGKPFYKCVVPKEGVTYVKPSHDDTILEVLVAW